MSTDLIKHTDTSTVLIDDVEIPVEVATDPVTGLSGRDELATGTGMFFDLDGHPVITMRGMKFSLDVIWISEDKKVVDISRNTLISVLGNDTLYSPEKPARYALEINAGEAQKRGIKVDAEVEINLLPNSDLTRLLVLEEVLEHLLKEEQRDYDPEGRHRGKRGGKYFLPGERETGGKQVDVVQAPEAKTEIDQNKKPSKHPPTSTLVEGYVRDTETGRTRVVPRTPSGEAPTHLYRVMDKGEYDDAVGQGELKPAPDGDGRIFAAGEPSLQYAEPKPTVLVAIEYSDDDGWAARSGGAAGVTAATYNPIPISKVTVLADGANGRELRDNYKLISDNLSKLLVLETALEYLAKAVPGEKLEYLKPGEKAPRGIQVQRGARGGRGYYPSEVTAVEEEKAVLEEPTEEREIDAVQAPVLGLSDSYEMPKYDFSFDTYLDSDKDRSTKLFRKDEHSEEDWGKMFDRYGHLLGDDDDLVQMVITSFSGYDFIGAKDEKDLEEKKKAFVWNKYFYDIEKNTDGFIVNAYNPPRTGEPPSWVTDTDNALPDIPTDAIHIDDVPGWTQEYKYRGALKVNIGGKAGDIIKEADNVSGVVTRVFTPSVLKKLKLIDELPESGDSDFRAAQFGQTSRALRTITDEDKLKVARQFRRATQRSLEHRNLPEKFYVYRGGTIHKGLLTRGKEEQERIADTSQELLDIIPTSVSFDVNLAAAPEYTGTAPDYYKEGVGEEEAVLTMYEVSRDDVLLDMPALFHGQTEQELIILPKNLKNPRKVVLPKIPKYYPAELGEEELQRREEKAKKEGDFARGFGGGVHKSNLSKLLALTTGLEYLVKQSTKREYLAPGEEAPEGIRVERGARGGRYYDPTGYDARNARSEEGIALPEEEREIDVVSPSGPEEQVAPSEPLDMLNPEVINEHFDTVATNLEDQLIKIVGKGHKPFLGKEILPSKLTADNITKAGYTDGTKEGTSDPSGMGINTYENFTVTIETEGQEKPFIYKMVLGENRGELLAYSIDRVLGLNIVPFAKQHSIAMSTLSDRVEQTQGKPIFDARIVEMREKGIGERAAGHFQEFCENCVSSKERTKLAAEMLSTATGREEFFKIMFLDYLTGNHDRHTGNYLITEDKKMVAIDNGMFAGTLTPHQKQISLSLNSATFGYFSFPYDIVNEMENVKSPTEAELFYEASNFFDKYFDLDKLDAILAPINWKAEFTEEHDVSRPVERSATIIERFAERFVTKAVENMQEAFSTGWNYGSYLTPFDFTKNLKQELANEGINIEVIRSLNFDAHDIDAIDLEEPDIYEEDEFN